jgi:ribose 5-phosphate isomerase A
VTPAPDLRAEKQAAARAAAALVEDGMRVGLGTGTTVAELVPVLGDRHLAITCVATSPATEELARAHGLDMRPFTDIERLDVAIDGADQVDPAGWLVKGGGGAQTRERIVAAAADRFLVIVSSDKPVARLHPPVPLELLAFGLAATLHALPGALRRDAPRTPDGGVLADYHGEVGDPGLLSEQLDAVPGLVSHGLFAPSMVDTVFIARGEEVEARRIS